MVIGDRYAAQWVIVAFRKCGINYQHSERDRSAIYLDALPLFSSGRVRLIDSMRLVGQFASLERIASPAGKDKIQHPRGGHDDACNSAAGALVLAQVGSQMMSTASMEKVTAMALRLGAMQRKQRAMLGVRF